MMHSCNTRLARAVGGAIAAIVLIACAAFGTAHAAGEAIDYDGIGAIKRIGLDPQKSQVMEISSWLEDVYGPRLTGSPNIQKAAEWAMGTMKQWGLENVAMEPWAERNGFERGWTNEKFYMAARAPQAFSIPGTPTAWTPGTDGLVAGGVLLVAETKAEDLQKYAGKLKGKWILGRTPPDVPAFWTAPASRDTVEDLERIQLAAPPGPEFGVVSPEGGRFGRGVPTPASPVTAPAARGDEPPFNRTEFFRTEGALGVLSTTPRGHGVYTIGGNRTTDPATSLPQVVIPAEQYNRIARMLAKNLPVTIEADIRNTFVPNPPMFNVVGEIRGSEKPDEIVMLGAHFDSWHAATGATDNGAGSAAMLEAMRILKQSGVKLRRTVRIGLWTGEEQGIIGSREYVWAHFGRCNDPLPAPGAQRGRGEAGRGGRGGGCRTGFTLKADHAKFAGYFNIDNGTGAIRGVYLQGNDAVAPIFREWMEPFRGIGMTTLTVRNTGGTDHLSFDAVGLPGFQFIQDAIEYDTMTHHTNLDSYERLQPNDMMKNATIAAAFAYLAANREEKLPRKPMPVAAERGTGQ
jgi:carboxypeptidase Q